MNSSNWDWKHIVIVVLGVVASLASAKFGYDFKGDLCGNAAPAAQSQGK